MYITLVTGLGNKISLLYDGSHLPLHEVPDRLSFPERCPLFSADVFAIDIFFDFQEASPADRHLTGS